MPDQPNESAGQAQSIGQPITGDANPTAPVAGNLAGKEAATNAELRPVPEDFGNLTKHRLPWGVAGVFMWLLLFSAGVLIPAGPSRINLGWKPEPEVQANANTNATKLEERIAELEKKSKVPIPGEEADPKITDSTKPKNTATPPAPVPDSSPPLADTAGQGMPPANPDTSKAPPKQQEPPGVDRKHGGDGPRGTPPEPPAKQPNKIWSFVVATCTFTPLNIGFLCILAAFIGGCSINKNEIHRIQQEIFDLEANPPIPPNPELVRLRQRLDYLTEHPGYSTIRGLVVYLIIISGLFIIGAPLAGVEGNQAVSLGQYMKLAGLFSFFGYLSGYDPTVFSTVIGFGTKQLSPGQSRS